MSNECFVILYLTVGCTVNTDCLPTEQCLNGKCKDPCTVGRPCPPTFTCTPQNHFPQCSCIRGIANLTSRSCDVPLCTSSINCPDHLVCYQGKCVDLCEIIKPCGINANCEIIDHNPICSCDRTLTGDPYIKCVEFERPQCLNDLECPDEMGCIQGKCGDICDHMNICGENSKCRINRSGIRKSVFCECIDGYSGDPYTVCSVDTRLSIGCRLDSDCDINSRCINGKCGDTCELDNICRSSGAECRSINHRPLCYCPSGYVGDPATKCTKVECVQDNDCNFDSICLRNRCVNTCSVNDKCGTNARCHSDNHSSQCLCFPGFTGDPYRECTEIQCFTNLDCADSLICTDNACVNPCKTANPCRVSQVCDVVDHRILCTCENGFILRENDCQPQPGKQLSNCIVDADCSDDRACMAESCKNMCDDKPCGINATCQMRHKNNDAMVTCVCGEGFVGNPFEECVEVPRVISGCRSNSDCHWTESCDNGKCKDPCLSNTGSFCGDGALCQVTDHRPICSCPLRHAGDPLTRCYLGKIYCPWR